MRSNFSFRGGSSDKKNKNIPDTFKSRDTFELILALGEGPWWGPAQGAHSLYFNQTPIVGNNGKSNFSNVKLIYYPGSDAGEEIRPKLGGFGSSVPDSNVSLAQDTPVVRDGVQTQIDWVELRFLIQSLYISDDKGTRGNTAQVKVEWKKASDASWTDAVLYTEPVDPTPTGPAGSEASYAVYDPNEVTDAVGNVTVVNGTNPGTPDDPKTVWLDSSNGYKPYVWDTLTSSWVSDATTVDTTDWQFTDPYDRVRKVYVEPEITPFYAFGDISLVAGLALAYNGTSLTNTPTGTSYADGVIYFNEKLTSSAVKEVRFPVVNTDEVIEYRITKLSADSTDTAISEIALESIEEVRSKSYTFPGTPVLQVVGQATDQLSSLPTIQGIYKMKLVKVPSNLNLTTYEYEGVWDGTYQMAWTDSVPWIFMDYVENTRFGLSRIFPHVCDKWQMYAWAQHTDTWVDDGKGGLRRRWTFNNWQTEKVGAKEYAQMIASAGGARYLDDGNGLVTVLYETEDEPVVALFTNENVVDGAFRYSFTDRLTRSNQVWARFKNPDLFYRPDKRPVAAQDDIDEYGTIPEEFDAVGCRSVSEALARARYRLITAQTEKMFTSFQTHRKGRYLRPWQLIAVADADASHGISGTVVATTGARSFTIREPITLEEGFTYTLQLDIPNPDYPVSSDQEYKLYEFTITTEAGTVTELSVDADLPELTEFCTFAIGCADTIGVPKVYRVQKISEVDGNPDKVQITALECNRSKWAYIDGSVAELTDDDTYPFYNGQIEAVENINLVFRTESNGLVSTLTATLTWDKSPTAYVKSYKVFDALNDGPSSEVGQTSTNSFYFSQFSLGQHALTVVPIDFLGRPGPAKTYRIDATGDARPLQSVTNLRLAGGGTTFSGTSAVFQWNDATPDTAFSHYRVKVYTTAGNILLRTENVLTREWTYDFDKIRADGSVRNFKITVEAVDLVGYASKPTSITVSNPPPDLPSHTTQQSPSQVLLLIDDPVDPDFTGFMVWASSSTGFTVGEETLVWKGLGKPTLVGPPGTTIYYKYAAYDAFGTTGLNISPQHVAVLGDVEVGPEILDRLNELENAYPQFAIVGAHGSIEIEANVDAASAIDISAGYFDHPVLGEIEVEETWFSTPWGVQFAPSSGWFAIIWSETLTSERFTNMAGSGHFFPAVYESGVWKAYKNSRLTGEVFTPEANDVVIGRAYKPLLDGSDELSSADGVTEVINLVRDTLVVNQKIETVEVTIGSPSDPANSSGSLFARWNSMVIAQADEAEARVTAFEELEASLDLSNASISTLETAVATAEGAIATIETEIDAARGGQVSLSARFSQIITAYTDGDAANALAVSMLSVTTETIGASVSTIQSALAGGGASQALLAFLVDTDTNQAELKLFSTSGGVWDGSAIELTADWIRLHGNVILDGTITAAALDPGSIAAIGYVFPTAGPLVTTYFTKATKSVTTDGGPVEIEFAALFEIGSPAQAVGSPMTTTTVYAKILRDSTEIVPEVAIVTYRQLYISDYDETFNLTQDVQQGRLITIDEPAAGTYTYSVQIKVDRSGSDFGLYGASIKDTARVFRIVNPSDGPNAVSGPT